MYTVCGTRKAMYVRELYRSVQQVIGNVVNMRVIPLACCTTMQAFRIVHLLYEAPRVFIAVVHSLWYP